MPIGQQIERRLRDADVRLDPDNRHGGRRAPRREVLSDRRHPHGEGGLVDVRGKRLLRRQLAAGLAQARAVLRRGVDGDGEDARRADQLLRRGDAGAPPLLVSVVGIFFR